LLRLNPLRFRSGAPASSGTQGGAETRTDSIATTVVVPATTAAPTGLVTGTATMVRAGVKHF
jgi:hypothetical protein